MEAIKKGKPNMTKGRYANVHQYHRNISPSNFSSGNRRSTISDLPIRIPPKKISGEGERDDSSLSPDRGSVGPTTSNAETVSSNRRSGDEVCSSKRLSHVQAKTRESGAKGEGLHRRSHGSGRLEGDGRCGEKSCGKGELGDDQVEGGAQRTCGGGESEGMRAWAQVGGVPEEVCFERAPAGDNGNSRSRRKDVPISERSYQEMTERTKAAFQEINEILEEVTVYIEEHPELLT